jgi:hypothetical protein
VYRKETFSDTFNGFMNSDVCSMAKWHRELEKGEGSGVVLPPATSYIPSNFITLLLEISLAKYKTV